MNIVVQPDKEKIKVIHVSPISFYNVKMNNFLISFQIHASIVGLQVDSFGTVIVLMILSNVQMNASITILPIDH